MANVIKITSFVKEGNHFLTHREFLASLGVNELTVIYISIMSDSDLH